MRMFQNITFKQVLVLMLMLFLTIVGVTEYAAQHQANTNLRTIDSKTQRLADLDKTVAQIGVETDKNQQTKQEFLQELYPVNVALDKGYSKEVGFTIIREAKKYDLRPSFIMGLIETESTWINHTPNYASATGLMQVEYVNGTAREIANALGFSSYDLMDPVTNIKFGTYQIARLIRTYGDVHTALTAYNCGEGGMQTYRANYGTSRSGYSRKVLNYQEHYENH